MPSMTVVSIRSRLTTGKHSWPAGQFYTWAACSLISAIAITGAFAYILETQSQLQLQSVWMLPFGVIIGALTIVAVIGCILVLAMSSLPPGATVFVAAAVFTLCLTGIVGTALQLFGTQGTISADCQAYVLSKPVTGPSLATLAWLHQKGLCSAWYVGFVFFLIGAIVQVWMLILSVQVSRDQFMPKEDTESSRSRSSRSTSPSMMSGRRTSASITTGY